MTGALLRKPKRSRAILEHERLSRKTANAAGDRLEPSRPAGGPAEAASGGRSIEQQGERSMSLLSRRKVLAFGASIIPFGSAIW